MTTSRRGSWLTPWATRRGLAQRQQEPARQHQTRHGSGQGVAWGGRRSEFGWNDVKPQAGVLLCLRSQGLKRLWFEKRLREEWHLSLDAQMMLEIISDPAQSVQSGGGQKVTAGEPEIHWGGQSFWWHKVYKVLVAKIERRQVRGWRRWEEGIPFIPRTLSTILVILVLKISQNSF